MTKTELKKQGFELLSNFTGFYISKQGQIYNTARHHKEIKPNKRGFVFINNKHHNFAKLILTHFKGLPARNGRIAHIDGNSRNFALNNLKYVRVFGNDVIENINNNNLLTAIRCYFEVKKSFKPTNVIVTGLYLSVIVKHRARLNEFEPHETEILTLFTDNLCSYKKTAETLNMNVLDCRIVIKRLINKLANNIITDLNNNYLQILPFIPRKPSKKQVLKQWNDFVKNFKNETEK